MADATRTTHSVEQTVTVNEDVVVLTMTPDEASAVFALLRGTHGPVRNVVFALMSAGVTSPSPPRSPGYGVFRNLL